MKSCAVLLFVIVYVACLSEALKCRNEEGLIETRMAEVMKKCMQNEGHNNESSKEDSSHSGHDHDDDGDNPYESSRHFRSTTAASKRQRRQSNTSGNPNASTQSPQQGQSDNSTKATSDESCEVQCFLQELKMTSESGLPDKNMMKNVMLNKVRDAELKEFLQESVDECFQLLESENHVQKEKCSYSKNLMSCLSERGRAQCDDWQEAQMRF